MTFTPQELHLIRLLSERFDVRELHRLLVGLSDKAPLKAQLMEPTSTSPQAFATHALLVLRAAGLVDGALFDALVTERASLAGEIWGVAGLFGVSHPDATPVEPLPEHFAALAEAHAALRTFVGRAEQLALLRAVLLPGPARPASVCSLQGMAGVGKSFLVERFYADHLTSFPGGHLKITLGYDAVPTAEGLLSELAERLGVLQGPGRVEERVRGAALATRALVHLDNLDSEEQAQAAAALVRRLSHMPLLLTGRYAFDAELLGWRVVTVAPFEEPEALQQLHRELGEARAKREPEADKQTLVTTLAGLPLAISLAGAVLRSGRSIKTFLERHSARLLSMKAERAPNTLYLDQSRDELQSLAATFALSIEALREKLGKQAEAGLPAVCALGVAPLVGVRLGWLVAIMGVEEGWAEDWLSDAVTLSIVQRDVAAGRWRVHKLLAEYLRDVLRGASRVEEPASAQSAEVMKPHNAQAPGRWARVLAWLRALFGRGDESATASQHAFVVASAGLEADAIARMDAWVLERLPAAPDETRGARWGALHAEHEAVAEWVAGLDGERAVVGGQVGYAYALVSGPYAAWLGAVARGLTTTTDARARSDLLWHQGNLARQAGDLELTVQAAKRKGEHAAAQGWDREVALSAGLRADVLQAQGQLDEALRIRWEEEIPVYERLGDVRSKAATMGKIAEVLQVRGQLDEALRIRWEEEIPVYERLGDVLAKAVTMGKIAEVLQARGQLDEALKILREEVLPAFERLSDAHSKAGTVGRIAGVLQARGQLDEALKILRDDVLPAFERLGDVRNKALTMGKIADVLETQGQLDEALKIRREEVLPAFERLGDVRAKAVTMGKIADVLQARGQLDEALKIFREEVLPAFERLGEVRTKAVTTGMIADVLQARGQLDEALRMRRDELPTYEALGDKRALMVGRTKIALNLLAMEKPEHIPEARALLLAAEAAAVEMKLPRDLAAIRSWFPDVGLPT